MSEQVPEGIKRLNALSYEEARDALLRCCGSSRWADAMARARPFFSTGHLLRESDWLWGQTGPSDWHEAFSHHPRIGDLASLRERFASTADLASREQGGMAGASEEVLSALAEGNRAYEERFGFIFLACATGKSAEELLALLRERLGNRNDVEMKIAVGEQARITRLRLERLAES